MRLIGTFSFFVLLVLLIGLTSTPALAGLVNESNGSAEINVGGGNLSGNLGSGISVTFNPVETTTTTTTTTTGGGGAATAIEAPTTAKETYKTEIEKLQSVETVKGLINTDAKLQDAIKTAFNLPELTDEKIKEIAEITATAVSKLSSERNFVATSSSSTLSLAITYSGGEKLDFVIYDTVPKTFATSSDLITVTAPGAVVTVVEKDPLYSFKYPSLTKGETKTVNYTVTGKKNESVLTEISAPTIIAMKAAAVPAGEEKKPVEEATGEVKVEVPGAVSGKGVIWILVILTVIAALVVGVYYLKKKKIIKF